MNILPRISIVTPSLNQGRYLERSIQSVLNQKYPNLEYIIIDGNSTDSSITVINKYVDHLSYWVSEKDRGQSHAINKGFDRSTGDIYSWLNSDDYLLPGALHAVAEAYKKNPDAGAWVGDCLRTVEGADEKYVLEAKVLDFKTLGERWRDIYFGQPSCFFSVKAWKECGPLDEDLHYSMDLDLWLKMIKKFRFLRIPTLLSCAPKHVAAKTIAEKYLSSSQSWVVRAKHGFGEAVQKEIATILAEHDEYESKILRVTQSGSYRILRPILRMWGLVG